MISATSALCALVAFALFVWRRRKFYILSWKVDGPTAWPLLGNVGFFLDSPNFVQNCVDLCTKFPKWYRLWAGPHLAIFLNRPELVEMVLKSPHALDKGPMYRVFTIVIGGDGLFNSAGKDWHNHRKFLNPTLQHYSLLGSFQPSFNRHLKELVAIMDARVVGDGVIDIYSVIEKCTLDILCETTFGIARKDNQIENDVLLANVNEVQQIAGMFFTKPWYHIKPFFWMTKHFNTLETKRVFGYEYVKKIINQKTKDYESSVQQEDGGVDKRVVHNFINECLRLSKDQKLFTNDDLIFESLTMLTAGFETTALSVSYVLLMLAMHPDCQQKVFDELQSIFPDQSSDVTSADLSQLQYTNQVINESLRLNPVVPYMTRMTNSDLDIENVCIPAGAEIVLPIFQIHRHKSVWGANANDFNPDHFLPENKRGRHPYAYLPFSAGPRNCIGNKYAFMSVRFFVCWLVRHFRFSTTMRMEDMKYQMSITLKLVNGHMLEVHRRENY